MAWLAEVVFVAAVEAETREGSLFNDYFKYTSTVPMGLNTQTMRPDINSTNFYKRTGVSDKGISFIKKIPAS